MAAGLDQDGEKVVKTADVKKTNLHPDLSSALKVTKLPTSSNPFDKEFVNENEKLEMEPIDFL